VVRFGLLLGLVWLVLAVYSIIDCLQRPTDRVRALPKTVWVLVIVLLPLGGALCYLLIGRAPNSASPAPIPRSNPAPMGPDDDEDFLRQVRQRAQEQRDEYRRQQLDKKLDQWESQQGDQHRDGSEPGNS